MTKLKDLKWLETNVSRCRHFVLGDEPMALHVITTGFKNEYVAIEEYADSESYDMFILTGAEVKEKYGITV
tara:strand:- start:6584 stop:6796 length:213 start_codon:yes stop_codon:yes gene_type:complete